MRNKSLKGWNYTDDLECLVLFATLIDEMTFNYTFDSYKAPALNVISLLNEAEETLFDIGRGVIREEGVRSVMEELSYSILDDEIFKQILNHYGLSYIATEAWLSSSHADFINCFAFLKQIKIAEIYFCELKSKLSSLIKSNKEKKKIENFTRIFVSYLCYLGYSEEFIYMETAEFFFRPTSNVIDVNAIDLFLSKFDGKKRTYSVINIGNPLFKSIRNAFNKSDKIEENLTHTITHPKIDNFKKYKGKNQVFITVSVKACDSFSARAIALEYIHKHSRTFLFYHHKKELSVQNICLVIDELTKHLYLIKKPTNNILRCEDLRINKALKKVVKTNNYVNYKNDSMMRIEISKQLHEDALLTDNLNNQFVNLFTALEVLIPKNSESKSARIDQIYQTLIPFLCVNYYRKLIGSIDLSLKQWNRNKYMRILSEVTEGDNDIEKLCALMLLKKYDNNGQEPKKELDLLYDELTSDGFILMRHRMFDLHKILSKPKEILSFLERHEKRIKWHIDRIYRTRNMIVHAGKSPFYISTLVENLHCYYDILVNQLINDNIDKQYDSIELSYISTAIKYKSYKNMLQSAGGNIKVDENNYISYIFNQ